MSWVLERLRWDDRAGGEKATDLAYRRVGVPAESGEDPLAMGRDFFTDLAVEDEEGPGGPAGEAHGMLLGEG